MPLLLGVLDSHPDYANLFLLNCEPGKTANSPSGSPHTAQKVANKVLPSQGRELGIRCISSNHTMQGSGWGKGKTDHHTVSYNFQCIFSLLDIHWFAVDVWLL